MLKPYYSQESTNIEIALRNIDTKTIMNRIKENYVEFWNNKITKSSKLSFFCHFKKDYKLEDYFHLIKNPIQRKHFSTFRISNHKFEIEYGRYKDIPREQRLCKLCNSGEVEDEFHVAFACKTYETLINYTNDILKDFFQLCTTSQTKQKLLEHLMSSNDIVLINLFSKCLSLCLIERENSLKHMDIT